MAVYNVDWSSLSNQETANDVSANAPSSATNVSASPSTDTNITQPLKLDIPQTQQQETSPQINILKGEEVPVPATEGQNVEINVQANDEESKSFLEQVGDYAVDELKGAARGAIKGYNAMLGLGASTGDFVDQMIDNTLETGSISEAWDKSKLREVKSIYDVPEPDWLKPQTIAGDLVEGIAQFMVGFVPVTKMKLFGTGISKMGKLSRELLEGGIVDFATMKANQQNATGALVEAFPQLKDSILSYLANDGGEEELTARFNNVFEGMTLGVAFGGKTIASTVMDFLKTGKLMARSNSEDELLRLMGQDPRLKHWLEDTPSLREALMTPEEKAADAGKKAAEAILGKPQDAGKAVADAALNAKVGVKPVKELLEGVADWKTVDEQTLLNIRTRVMENPKELDQLITNVNFSTYASTSPDGIRFLKGLTEEIAGNLDRAKTRTWDSLVTGAKEATEAYGLDFPRMIALAKNAGMSLAEADIASMQMRAFLPGLGREVYDRAGILSRKIADNTVTPRDKAEFIILSRTLQNMFMATENLKTATARSLNANKKVVNPNDLLKGLRDEKGKIDMTKIFDKTDIDKMSADDVTKLIDNSGLDNKKLSAFIENILMSGGDPKKAFKTMLTVKQDTLARNVNYFFVNNILSGLFTHTANTVGNVINSYLMPASRLAGAIVTADKNEVVYNLRVLKYLTTGWSDGLEWAGAAYRSGTSMLKETPYSSAGSKFVDSSIGQNGLPEATSTLAWMNLFRQGAKDPDAPLPAHKKALAYILGWAGTPARLNATLMTAEDELSRQMMYRAQMRAQIDRDLDKLGVKGREARLKAAKDLEKKYLPQENGALNLEDPDVKEAFEQAKRAVFAEDTENKIIDGLNSLSNRSIFVKTGLPFIHTVFNVMRNGIEYVPGMNFLSARTRADIAAGGVRREAAIGRMMIGTASLYQAWQWCNEGKLVGALSEDDEERQMQERAGIKPYSIKVGDSWVQYQRGDPIATPLAIAANLYQVINNDDTLTMDNITDMIIEGLASLESIIVDKSFLSGLKDMSDAINNPKEKLPNYLVKAGQAYIPGSSFLKQAGYLADPNRREGRSNKASDNLEWNPVTSFMESLHLKAQTVPLKYDWLTGESVTHSYLFSTPDHQNEMTEDVVNELLNHRVAAQIHGEPERQIGQGVELSNAEYSELCKLHGTVRIGGKTLIEALHQLINSPQYDRYRERLLDTPDERESYRATLVNKVIGQYREYAKYELQRRHPELIQKRNEAFRKSQFNKSPQSISQGQSLLNSLNP